MEKVNDIVEIKVSKMKTKLKIMGVFLEYDLGSKTNDSFWKTECEPTLKKLSSKYQSFYYDDYLDDLDKLEVDLICAANKFRPDIIFFMIKDEFSFRLLDYLKEICKTVNISYDDQWRFDSFTKYIASHFSYLVSSDNLSGEKLEKLGLKNNVLTHIILKRDIRTKYDKDIKYKYNVSFIGGKSEPRQKLINFLKNNGIKVNCFGAGWDNGRISNDEMDDIIYKSKINLNTSNSLNNNLRFIIQYNALKLIHSNIITGYIFGKLYLLLNCILREYHNDGQREYFNKNIHTTRSFFKLRTALKMNEQAKTRHLEIPSQCGFQLSFYDQNVEYFFEDKKEIAMYKDWDDLVKKIKYYLDHDKEREKIKLNAYKKVVNQYQNKIVFNDIITRVMK